MAIPAAKSAALVLALAVLCASPAALIAQVVFRAEDVRVGSDEERYLRALSLLAPTDLSSWMVRPAPAHPSLVQRIAGSGPWSTDTSRRTVSVREVSVDVAFNTLRPTSRFDGPAWSGRGTSARGTGSATWRSGRVEARVGPMLWWAANSRFDLTTPWTGSFVDGLRPVTIDLPQRFGDEHVARLDSGESSLFWLGDRVHAGVTTAAAHLGPGGEHAIILQADGGGYPRVEVGTSRMLQTVVGAVSGRISWGRTPQSSWSPDRRTGALLTSYIVGTWRPRGLPGLEVGMTRLTHVDWLGFRLRDLLVPFGSVYQRAGAPERPDNQIASVHARLHVPAAGLEFFGEYAKNDRSASLRDYAIETEHGAAWLAGMQRAWRDASGRLWAFQATGVGGAIAPSTEHRLESTFYDHFPLAQGHTLRGQLLGTPLNEREGGLELRLDRYDVYGRTGLLMASRGLTNEYAASVDPENLRQEWSLMVDRLHWTRSGAIRLRLAGIADLGYSPVEGDAFSLHLAVGYVRRH